jgi:geranylgeranylglycerol-phosphate geranylgeranyltransferase
MKTFFTVSKLAAVVQITRPLVCIVGVLYTLLGIYLGGNLVSMLTPTALRATLVVYLVMSFGFVINDYRDASSDLQNHPNRPIPSNRISKRTSLIQVWLLAFIIFVIALTLKPFMLAITLLNMTLTTLYSYFLKSTVLLGNLTIAFLSASMMVFGCLAISIPTPAVWILSLLTFLYILAQEILLTMRDREGDAQFGICTLATRFGTIISLHFFCLITFIFILTSLLVWVLGLASNLYLFAITICSILPLLGSVILLGRSQTKQTIYLSVRILKIARFFSILPGVMLK